jgi:hypothetical protein
MPESLISEKASNWVDRGAPAGPVIARVLGFFFDRHGPEDHDWLALAAEDVIGMVAADATDVAVAGYLKSVARSRGIEFPARARQVSISCWHIAKAALVRDRAEILLRRAPPTQAPQSAPLAEWVASKMLTPDEFAEFKNELRRAGAEHDESVTGSA